MSTAVAPLEAEAMEVVLAQPRGFCAGVSRAIDIVEQALSIYGAPVYVFHEIVHNGYVVRDLASRGAVFVDEIESIPRGAVTVFSAHGVSDAVVAEARARHLEIIDATCPLVAKVHLQAKQYAASGHAIVMIGHPGHEEVEGTMGSAGAPVHLVSSPEDIAALEVPAGSKVAYVTQTTLSVDDTEELIRALSGRYPGIVGPKLDDICYATLNRQRAVRALAEQVQLVLVVGARNSSNSNRLREVASQAGVASYLIEHAGEIDTRWLVGVTRIGVTAGASAPEILVTQVQERLRELGAGIVRELPGAPERVTFRLPTLVKRAAS
jgi:4-hydroxy-3-methylbut-2-enyl diphosphate reductase